MTEHERITRAGTKCLVWGVILLVIAGTSFLWVYLLPQAFGDSGVVYPVNVWGRNALFFLMQLVQGIPGPLGAVLIGAGIVLRVLAPRTAPEVDATASSDAP